MKILITGGCGFLGSKMLEFLFKDEKNYIYVIDNLSTGYLSNIQKFLGFKRVKFIKFDICNESIVKKIKKLNVQRIYNFACPASPFYYQKHPIETWEASVLGVRNLLKAIQGTRIRLFQSSTSEVYGDPYVSPQKETYWGNVNPIGVRSCYDEGKRSAESLLYDFKRKNDVDIRVARIFNTYGPNMAKNDGRIISNFITQALDNNSITIYGNGKQTRSFCFVDDTIYGIYLLMESDYDESPINIGNPNETTVLEIAQQIKKMTNSSSDIIFCKKSEDDPQQRNPSIEDAKKFIKWEPTITLKQGLEITIKYFMDKK